MHTIALDVMGGDDAPSEPLKGAFLAVKEYKVKVDLVGPQDVIREELQKLSIPEHHFNIVHAPDVVGMSESPSLSFRKKKESSIRVGLERVKSGQAQAFVSAGNTGAVMAASTFILGRIPKIERPAIAAILPSKKDPIVMLDMGANVDCKPEHLCQFAFMGHFFNKLVLKHESPKVALLNIGEERDKGDSLTLATYQILEKLPLNFVGNIEGKEILLGTADVIVCDGFVGNCVLKFGEGVADVFTKFFKSEAKRSLRSLLGLLLLKPAFTTFKKDFDYTEYGGAPLLGVDGVSIIAHGSSNDIAVKNAIRLALQAIDTKMVDTIKKAVADVTFELDQVPA